MGTKYRTKCCAKCPFRKDVAPYITPEAAEEFLTGELFTCHETIGYGEDDYGNETHDMTKGQTCAGWLAMRENMEENGTMPVSQMMRIAERLGLYDRGQMTEARAMVYDDMDEMIDACAERNA